MRLPAFSGKPIEPSGAKDKQFGLDRSRRQACADGFH